MEPDVSRVSRSPRTIDDGTVWATASLNAATVSACSRLVSAKISLPCSARRRTVSSTIDATADGPASSRSSAFVSRVKIRRPTSTSAWESGVANCGPTRGRMSFAKRSARKLTTRRRPMIRTPMRKAGRIAGRNRSMTGPALSPSRSSASSRTSTTRAPSSSAAPGAASCSAVVALNSASSWASSDSFSAAR